jgi:hypothetical protein
MNDPFDLIAGADRHRRFGNDDRNVVDGCGDFAGYFVNIRAPGNESHRVHPTQEVSRSALTEYALMLERDLR